MDDVLRPRRSAAALSDASLTDGDTSSDEDNAPIFAGLARTQPLGHDPRALAPTLTFTGADSGREDPAARLSPSSAASVGDSDTYSSCFLPEDISVWHGVHTSATDGQTYHVAHAFGRPLLALAAPDFDVACKDTRSVVDLANAIEAWMSVNPSGRYADATLSYDTSLVRTWTRTMCAAAKDGRHDPVTHAFLAALYDAFLENGPQLSAPALNFDTGLDEHPFAAVRLGWRDPKPPSRTWSPPLPSPISVFFAPARV